MIEGVSGLLSVHQPDERPDWSPSRDIVVWPNGAVAQAFSAEDPDSLRGPQFSAAWCDELAKWRHAETTFDMLQFGLRLGTRPRQVITTTPRPIALLKRLIADPTTALRGIRREDRRRGGHGAREPPMTREDLIKIEQYRRFLRPDWRRLLPPDPEHGLTREQREAQRHDFMLRDRAFETPLARRLRKEQEEREQIEEERLEAEHQAEIERDVLSRKADRASLRFDLVWAERRWEAECADRNAVRTSPGSA